MVPVSHYHLQIELLAILIAHAWGYCITLNHHFRGHWVCEDIYMAIWRGLDIIYSCSYQEQSRILES